MDHGGVFASAKLARHFVAESCGCGVAPRKQRRHLAKHHPAEYRGPAGDHALADAPCIGAPGRSSARDGRRPRRDDLRGRWTPGHVAQRRRACPGGRCRRPHGPQLRRDRVDARRYRRQRRGAGLHHPGSGHERAHDFRSGQQQNLLSRRHRAARHQRRVARRRPRRRCLGRLSDCPGRRFRSDASPGVRMRGSSSHGRARRQRDRRRRHGIRRAQHHAKRHQQQHALQRSCRCRR